MALAMPSGVLLEICIASPQDAATAEAGGADRVELNAALELGGLTPSPGTLLEARRAVRLPIIAMCRPRSGGFHYSAQEFDVMRQDIDLLLENGADGIATGILHADDSVDLNRCAQLIRQIGPRATQGAVFHRAFDFTADPFRALEELIDLGFRRVMTSGQQPAALQGTKLIAELIGRSTGRIEILPAAGIRASNAAEIISATGCTQLHASLRESRSDASVAARSTINLGGDPSTADDANGTYRATSPRLLAEMVESLRKYGRAS
ncbi:MAG TPA: copper homeostasis protein CutC [Tepidisphaeraceae bacterium]|nr:copper homeostasis protein CutC [Tepidisphaeraceae bacterium]